MSTAPQFNIDPKVFWNDPYPILKQMRAEAPIAYVPEFDRVLITRRDDIVAAEPDTETFSSMQPNGLMTRLMGENLMRKGGAAHTAERKAIFPTVSPKTARDIWAAGFRKDAADILEDLAAQKQGNLFLDYATRLSGEALRHITGLTSMSWQDMDQASQAMIDGISNYAGDPEVEARCHQGTALIDRAIDQAIADLDQKGHDLLTVMLGGGMNDASVRANIKLTISGGQNEPRDVIAGIIWALLTHPQQLEMVLAGQVTWMQVFEEFVRWLAPIGMSPRHVARDATLGGVTFHKGDDVFFMFSSANHDEDYFDQPELFDVTRDAGKHIAFGAGPHFCAGAWASKALIVEVALPMIFARLKNLRLIGEPVQVGGWAFRGVLGLNCAWD